MECKLANIRSTEIWTFVFKIARVMSLKEITCEEKVVMLGVGCLRKGRRPN